VLGGECEQDLVALAQAVERGEDLSRFVQRTGAEASLARLDFPVPRREGLPPPPRYARLREADGRERLAGYAEASRGCLHRCRHCPIPAVYGGRFFAVPLPTVLADVAQQAAAGVTHVTFGDPDFLNGPSHALRLAREFHRRFPDLTFDFTAKVEHLVRDASLLPELVSCGAVFTVSAVESLSDRVLGKLEKGHVREDVFRAFAACDRAGLPLRPTLVPFTPWETLPGYLDLLETFEERGWIGRIDPVQFSLRLLVPPGSLLVGDPELPLEGLDAEALTWRWRHPDRRMDELQVRVATLVDAAATRGEDPAATVGEVKALALATAGRAHSHVARPFSTAGTPRLTESWFC
jgi:Radical SAM superfamily